MGGSADNLPIGVEKERFRGKPAGPLVMKDDAIRPNEHCKKFEMESWGQIQSLAPVGSDRVLTSQSPRRIIRNYGNSR